MLWCFIHIGFFRGRVQFFSSLVHFPFSHPPPPPCWVISIQPCLPVPHVIFFFFFFSLTQRSSSLLPFYSAWYSGVGMHAPSQSHQRQSECCTTAPGKGGMSGERGERWGEKGRDGGRSGACGHPSGTEAWNWQSEVRGEWKRWGKRQQERLPSFLSGHFGYDPVHISTAPSVENHARTQTPFMNSGTLCVCVPSISFYKCQIDTYTHRVLTLHLMTVRCLRLPLLVLHHGNRVMSYCKDRSPTLKSMTPGVGLD